MYFYVYIIFLFSVFSRISADVEEIRWCVISEAELMKCNKMRLAISFSAISQHYRFSCVFKKDVFDCLERIKTHKADLINLDVGLASYAINNYGLRAIAVENYNSETEYHRMKLSYTANAVVIKDSIKHPQQLRGTSACFSGSGTAESWIYPLATMINNNWIPIIKCNNVVQVATAFFANGSCIPGNRNEFFNPLGDNGESPCKHCSSMHDHQGFCSYSDSFAGNAGAIKCLDKAFLENRKSVAFVRGDVISQMISRGDINEGRFELLCATQQPDGTYNAPLDKIEQCNWGIIPSRMLITRLSSSNIPSYQRFIGLVLEHFGINGTNTSDFQIFHSSTPYEISDELQLMLGISMDLVPHQPLYDLMFSDSTKAIYFPPNNDIINYFHFVGNEVMNSIETLNRCPLPGLKWCMIDEEGLDKCGRMQLALRIVRIQPPLHCVLGKSTKHCMELIGDGYADLMTLDAAELYIGGKYMNLVPIAIEFYGDSTDYYGVAVAKKTDKSILISNWRNIETCHGGAGKATGWVLPITIALNTQQLSIQDGDLISSFAQLVYRACLPGILDDVFNPDMRNPINLCENCDGGDKVLCSANSNEGHYTDSGAFECLIESGDLAFVKHFTVYDNTEGRNSVDWARNKRLHDYELVCSDGRRSEISQWKECNIGKVPGNTVVTAGFKSPEQREAMWMLLRYSQEHFSSDGNSIFSMFESPYDKYDLMFSDAATSLTPIPLTNQTYNQVLDPLFVRQCENLENLSKPGYSGFFYKRKT